MWYDETARTLQYTIPNVTSAGAWRTGGNLNSGRWYTTGTGTESDMLLVGGEKSGSPAYAYGDFTEKYDGATWTELNDLNSKRQASALTGTTTAALCVAGVFEPGYDDSVESWDGTNWTETTDINTTRGFIKGSGTQTATIVFGGYTGTTNAANAENWNGSA